MPRNNRFRHQEYRSGRPTSDLHLLQPALPSATPTEAAEQLATIGQALQAADVRAIYLVHGSFVGADALGLIREVSRVSSAVADVLRRWQKQVLDGLMQDAGNYSPEYALALETGLNASTQTRIPVRLVHWSSENNHVARADGAVRLIDELATSSDLAGGRVLLWGHSHGGNVLALMTNLLAADATTLKSFFRAARSYYRWPLVGRVDIPVWDRVRQLLESDRRALGEMQLDCVTFGTPIRYGWDAGGYARLMHFVNHRPRAGLPLEQIPFPPELDDVLTARDGDYFQHVGLAGTNFPPVVWAWRAWLADVRLGCIVQAGVRRGDLLVRLKCGMRVPNEGSTLLVDYGPASGGLARYVAGHMVYTRREWMLFHMREIASRWYDCDLAWSPVPPDGSVPIRLTQEVQP